MFNNNLINSLLIMFDNYKIVFYIEFISILLLLCLYNFTLIVIKIFNKIVKKEESINNHSIKVNLLEKILILNQNLVNNN